MEARVSVLICRGPSVTQLTIFPHENQVPASQGASHGGMQPLESGVWYHLEPLAVLPVDTLSPLSIRLDGCGLGQCVVNTFSSEIYPPLRQGTI